MFSLILAILSSTLIALLMRFSENYRKNHISMLAVNYAVCLVCSLISSDTNAGLRSNNSIYLGILQGLLYLISFLLLQYNITRNGVVLSSTFMKLGVLVPTVASVLLFGETPSLLQGLGFILAIFAILMISLAKERSAIAFLPGLILLLITGGSTDIMAKIYEEIGIPSSKDQFILFTFLTAFILCGITAIIKKQRLCTADVLWGIAIGIPNYFSAVLLLNALHTIPAIIAYPTYSVTTMSLVSLGGIVLFKEELSRRQLLAIGLILISLCLLNL